MGKKSTGTVRTRYAPSPTGHQHIGGLRTALYNYLLARASGGAFVLRIEDTDRARAVDGAEQEIIRSLRWLGIGEYEGGERGGRYAPYRQSERKALYARYAQALIDAGAAYWAYDPDEELEELRRAGRGYDGRARHRSAAEIEHLRARGVRAVARLRISEEGSVSWDDAIVGRVTFAHADIPTDPVILKSDGFPTYHLAVVVDDHHMDISHVLRAQEWISSTPVHILLYGALGWQPPIFAHLPLIVGNDNKKLSKRQGALSVAELEREGIVPAALCNYIARLGWGYDGERELFTLQEMERLFSIDKIHKSPAHYDRQKLLWYNRHYIGQMGDEEFVDAVMAHICRQGKSMETARPQHAQIDDGLRRRLASICGELRGRLTLLSEAGDWISYLWEAPSLNAEQVCGKKIRPAQACALLEYLLTVEDAVWSDYAAVEERITEYAQRHAMPGGHSLGVLRYTLSGATRSLPVDALTRSLSAADIRQRIGNAVAEVRKIL